MLRRAGYLQRCRCAGVDERGRPCRIVEVALDGRLFGIRVGELRQALDGRHSARIGPLRQDWGPVLGDTVGRAERSRTGAAIVFELITGERYTVPAAALRAVLARAAAFAPVAAILPAGAGSPGHAVTELLAYSSQCAARNPRIPRPGLYGGYIRR